MNGFGADRIHQRLQMTRLRLFHQTLSFFGVLRHRSSLPRKGGRCAVLEGHLHELARRALHGHAVVGERHVPGYLCDTAGEPPDRSGGSVPVGMLHRSVVSVADHTLRQSRDAKAEHLVQHRVLVLPQLQLHGALHLGFVIGRGAFRVLLELTLEHVEGTIVGRARVPDLQLDDVRRAPHSVVAANVFVEEGHDPERGRSDFAVGHEEPSAEPPTRGLLEDATVVVHQEGEHIVIAGVETPAAVERGRGRLPFGGLLGQRDQTARDVVVPDAGVALAGQSANEIAPVRVHEQIALAVPLHVGQLVVEDLRGQGGRQGAQRIGREPHPAGELAEGPVRQLARHVALPHQQHVVASGLRSEGGVRHVGRFPRLLSEEIDRSVEVFQALVAFVCGTIRPLLGCGCQRSHLLISCPDCAALLRLPWNILLIALFFNLGKTFPQ